MKKLLLIIFFIGFYSTAQKVSNIITRQEQSTIIVSYDLETKLPCKVSLYVSTNGGTTWQGPLTKVTGDVGDKIISGKHRINWSVLEEFDELKGDDVKFQVRAKSYNIETVKIGTQEWTTKNLDVSTYRNGDVIPEVKDLKEFIKLTTGAWIYYNNDPKNGAIYGKLYNWYAVNDPRGLAPDGYHIPSHTELEAVSELSNINGFNGLAGGSLWSEGKFYEDGAWWTSSEVDANFAWARSNYEKQSGVYYGEGDEIKSCGFSVRCIKNKSINSNKIK